MSDTIKYTSDNGYTGVLYGQSSLSIYNPDGTEIMHTGFRNINTYEELVMAVDEHSKFMEMLRKVKPVYDEYRRLGYRLKK